MEYFRDPKNQIYADLAYRLGRIIVQYEKLVVKEKKYEATLYIAVLQNLMTNCNEYVRQMIRSERKKSIFNQEISKSGWGIDKKCWIKNTFNEEDSLQNFIIHIRNSVSHPKNIDIKSDKPSTGFTTIENKSGNIKMFRFIDSPDVIEINRLKEFTKNGIENTIYQRNSNNKIINHEFPNDINYEEIPDKPGKYRIIHNGKPFFRIAIIDLSVEQLSKFVKELSNFLAQPIKKEWDGVTIKELIAA
ncbi:MAG: hypothetical protein JXA68_00510 [Ignavibacteriales bacterium]|nr:hypothetical protein [Ignavibacteriales bacterium]